MKRVSIETKVLLLLLVIATVLQFTVGPSKLEAWTGCGCKCQDHSPGGTSICNGVEVQCSLYCAGKYSIADWGIASVVSVWNWYQLTGY